MIVFTYVEFEHVVPAIFLKCSYVFNLIHKNLFAPSFVVMYVVMMQKTEHIKFQFLLILILDSEKVAFLTF